MDDPKSSPWVPRCSLMHHTGRVWTLTFSPDGKWLATGAWDSTVYIYETSTLQLGDRFVPSCEPKKSQLHCHANVWTAEFQPKPQNDLLILATGAADHKVLFLPYPSRMVHRLDLVALKHLLRN